MNEYISLVSLALSILLGILYVRLAYKKSRHENPSLDGTAVQAYAAAAKLTGEEILRLREELEELREKTNQPITYHLDIIFTTGDKPGVEKVMIEQLIPAKGPLAVVVNSDK